jgi:hypothetical protein
MMKDSVMKTTTLEDLNAPRWASYIILSGVGGQGKTTLAEALSTSGIVNGRLIRIFSADIQGRLRTKFGEIVTELDIDLHEQLAEDALALFHSLKPVPAAFRAAKENPTDIILDTAAGWHEHTIRWAGELQLDKKAEECGGSLNILIVATQRADPLRLLCEATQLARRALPDARIVWVLNDRDGEVFGPSTPWDLIGYSQREVDRIRRGVLTIRIPATAIRYWGPVDLAGYSMKSFVEADPETLSHLWADSFGKPVDVDTATVAKRRVVFWIAAVLKAVGPVTSFRE